METTIAQLRLRLVDAQARLRSAKDDHGRIKAEREQAAIRAANGSLGKNQDERDRALTVALASDPEYTRARAFLRDAESTVDLITTQIENALDLRRGKEWQIRAHLADVLAELGVPSDSTEPAGDSCFDDATLDQLVSAIERIANDKRHQYAGVAREMVEAYTTGIADRINGAGEFEPDDWDDPASMPSKSGFQGIPERLASSGAGRMSVHRLDGPTTELDYYSSHEYRTQMDLERADADALMYEWAPETFLVHDDGDGVDPNTIPAWARRHAA